MDNKHFIWIVPLIFILGFFVGYISGLNVPNLIEVGIDNKTITFLEKYYDNMTDSSVEKYDYETFLNEIEKDCGTTDFVKRNNEWMLFGSNCISGEYCKYEDINIERCYNQ